MLSELEAYKILRDGLASLDAADFSLQHIVSTTT